MADAGDAAEESAFQISPISIFPFRHESSEGVERLTS